MNAIGAPLGGLLADSIGYRPTLWIALGGFELTALLLWLSPFRGASLTERPAGMMAGTTSGQGQADG